jgi:hypothetical protein
LNFPEITQCYASCTPSAELNRTITLVFLDGGKLLSAKTAWLQVEICNPYEKHESQYTRKKQHSLLPLAKIKEVAKRVIIFVENVTLLDYSKRRDNAVSVITTLRAGQTSNHN